MKRSVPSLSAPAELMFLEAQPFLLLGERRRDFEALRRVMIEEATRNQGRTAMAFGHCRSLKGEIYGIAA
jgi:hypothetical protein